MLGECSCKVAVDDCRVYLEKIVGVPLCWPADGWAGWIQAISCLIWLDGQSSIAFLCLELS